MKQKVDLYYESITYDNVVSTWKIVRKTCKNKKAILKYDINKNINNYNIYSALLNCNYKPYPFKLFLIFEPKARLVMSQTVSDKIVNHFIAKYYLLPLLEKKLINSNVATRVGKGSKMAEKLIVDYINKIRMKTNDDIYVLKIDISKYFYNINHEILINMLKEDINDKNIINIIKIILNETNKPYINETINKLNKKHNLDIPLYKEGVGLSIGAMTSQFLAIYYLNKLDHFIKEKLRCKYYIRYMDDFIILDINKDRLKYIFKLIEKELEKLKLNINPKSSIARLDSSTTFLGFRYRVVNNKFKVYYRSKTIKKIKKKLNNLFKYDLVKYYKSYGSYYGYLSKLNKSIERKFTMKTKEKYDYYKKENKNKIVFIKEGSFYKTYEEDAVIIWNMFKYIWNKKSISFGINTSSKVFDKLKSEDIGYITVDSDNTTVTVTGSDEVYDLYLKLSNINYDKYIKKDNLYKLLDKIDISYYDKVSKYLENLVN